MVSNWIQFALGAWIMVSPWVLRFSSITLMKWSNLLVGLVIVLMKMWEIYGGEATNDK